MSYVILQVLWKAATILKTDEFDWWTVRKKALMALSNYEVDDLNRSLGEMRGRHIQILQSEENTEVLRACEKLVVKFLCHEFEFRHRGQESVKHVDSKLRKLFAAIPQLFSTSEESVSYAVSSCIFTVEMLQSGNFAKYTKQWEKQGAGLGGRF